MIGRKLEFRTKQGNQLIPHWDEAKNIEYKNEDSGLNANTVQEAIDKLAKQSDGSGSTIVSDGRVIRLEDFPGYSDEFVADLPEWYDIRTEADCAIEDYIYGVYPIDTDFESMVVDEVPAGWKNLASQITWDENNPRNWYFKGFTGKDVENLSEGHSILRYYEIIRYGFTDKWFTTYEAALSALDSAEDNYGIFIAKRSWNTAEGYFERFDNPILIKTKDGDLDLTAANVTETDISNNTLTRVVNAQDKYLVNNKSIIDRARDTRAFLQSVFDSADPDVTVLFPFNKTLIIGFADRVYQYGNFNTVSSKDRDKPQYMYYDESNKYRQYPDSFYVSSLFIYHKIDVNLNGSSLTMLPNWHRGYSIVKVMSENLIDPHAENNFADVPGGGALYNGNIIGDLDNHIFLPISVNTPTSALKYSHVHEFCSGIGIRDVISLYDLNVYNFTGDGISVASPYEGISENIVCDTRGKLSELDDNGTIVNDSGENTGYWYNNTIISLNTIHPNRNKVLIIRPKYATSSQQKKYASTPEMAPYYIDEELAVAYYNLGGTCIKTERVCYGDNLNVPLDATGVRFFIHIDPTITGSGDPSRINLMPLEVDWKQSISIERCEIYNCGRNGMTPTAMKNGIIRSCNVHDCGFTTNQLAIDIEGVAGIDTGIEFSDIWLHGDKGSITSVTGDHVYITKSKVGAISIGMPHLHIEDCDCNIITGTSKYFNNMVKPRRVVQNCQIHKQIQLSYGLVSNCRIRGEMPTDMYNANSKYPTVYENCVIRCKNLAPGVYKNCNIKIDNALGDNKMYSGFDIYWSKDSTSLQRIEYNRYIFEDCKLTAASLYGVNRGQTYQDTPINALLNFRNCEITLDTGYTNGNYEDSGSHFLQSYIESFVDNTITVKATNNKPAIRFVPYGPCVIARNKFKVSNVVSNFIALMIKNYKTSVTQGYSIRIEDNVFEYVGTTSNKAIVIAETTKAYKPDANVSINITNNMLFKKDNAANITLYEVSSMTDVEHQFVISESNNNTVNGGELNI